MLLMVMTVGTLAMGRQLTDPAVRMEWLHTAGFGMGLALLFHPAFMSTRRQLEKLERQ